MITTVEGAARCLLGAWMGDRSLESYKVTCFTCLAALEGEATATQAREAVIEVAEDAGEQRREVGEETVEIGL